MADLTENAQFAPVPLLDDETDVEGGSTGESNAPAQALADRTLYLKNQLDSYPDIIPLMEQAITDHENDPDAHADYVTVAEADVVLSRATDAGTAGGPVPLNEDGVVDEQYLGNRPQIRELEVANEAARLALPVWSDGTFAHQIDTDTTWVLAAATDPSVSGNWSPLDRASVFGLESFNGRQGDVVPETGDYTTDQITETVTREFASPEEKDGWDNKQDTLVSGVNIKTVNNESLLGTGNIEAGFPLILPPIPLYVKDGTVDAGIQPIIGAEPYHSLYAIPRTRREFQVDIPSGDFSAPISAGNVVVDIWQVSIILTSASTYKWRARDIDAEGTASEWCEPQTFTVETISVNTPTITSPASGATFNPGSNTISSSGYSGGYPNDSLVKSEWEIRNSNGDVVYSTEKTNLMLSLTVPEGVLSSYSTYTVAVRHTATSGLVSAWSAPRSFVTPLIPFNKYLACGHGGSPYISIYGQDIDTLHKIPNPSTLPGAAGKGVAFSADGVYLAVATSLASPGVIIYKRNGNTFTKLTNPATLPGTETLGVAFSADGTYLAVATTPSPYVVIYKRSGDTFTKLANPDVLPGHGVANVAFSPDGNYLVATDNYFNSNPALYIYKRNGDVFNKLPDPANVPTNGGKGVAFSPDGNYLAVTYDAYAPYFAVFKREGDTFTKLADPAALPPASCDGIAWSPDGAYLAIAHAISPFISFYKREGDVLTKLPDPDVLPPGTGIAVAFSKDGQHLALGHIYGLYVYRRNGDAFNKLPDPATPPPASQNVYSVSFFPRANEGV